MNCKRFTTDFDAWQAGRLSPERRDRVDEHLKACAQCQEIVAADAAISEVFSNWRISPSPDQFEEELLASTIGAENATSKPARSMPWPWLQQWSLKVVASFALVIVLVLATVDFDVPPEPTVTQTELAQQKAEIDKVLRLFYGALHKSKKATKQNVLQTTILSPARKGAHLSLIHI